MMSSRARTNIRLKIEMDSEEPVRPGSVIHLTLKVFSNRPIQITMAKVSFQSTGQCLRYLQWLNGRWQRSGAQRITQDRYTTQTHSLLHHDHPAPQPHGVFTFSLLDDEPRTHRLHENQPFHTSSCYSLRVRVEVPEDVPDSWNFIGKEYGGMVKNTLEALVSYLRLDVHDESPGDSETDVDTDGLPIVERLLWTEHVICVRNDHVVLEQIGCHRVHADAEDVMVGMPWLNLNGRIHVQLTARDRLVRLGDEVRLIADINNSSTKTLRKVTLTLFKEYNFKDDYRRLGYVNTQLVKAFKVALPTIPSFSHWHREIKRFKIPAEFMTSGSLHPCSFVKLNFFVRLKVKWWFGSLKCDVYLLLGTHACQRWPLPSPNLPRHEITEADILPTAPAPRLRLP